ncbi:MAG TPA: hemolysin D [Candidatus Marinimicrobia bacterium]|nr:hemolysin D [Candidatus Neomarinimicrobiota bacterium]
MNTERNTKLQKAERLADSITHGMGVLLSIAALVLLIVIASMRGNAWNVVSFTIFGSSLIILYLASTLFHSISHPAINRILQRIDHSAIYILIAGSYTPFLLGPLRGAWGWTIFGIIWGLAILGILYKTFYFHRFTKLSTLIYIVMGWLVVIIFRQLLVSLSTATLILLVSGGLSYTFGTIFYSWERLPFNHAIWHLFVLGGSVCHFFAVAHII